MKWKTLLLKILRWLTAAAVVMLLVFSIGRVPSPNIPFDKLSQSLVPLMAEGQAQIADSRMVRRLYGLNPADYEGLTLYYPITNMEVDELLIVKLNEETQAEAVKSAIDSRLAAQKQSFEGYGDAQTYALNYHMFRETEGIYILFTVSSQEQAARNIQQMFLKVLKEG